MRKKVCKREARKTEEKFEAQPSYWAVIPSTVRYDTVIPANAKLLYAEISSLTQALGYCYAPNSYFARLFTMTERTIERLIIALQRRGYIRVEVRKGNQHQAYQRRIYAGLNPLSGEPGPANGGQGAGDKIVGSSGVQATKLSGASDKIVGCTGSTLYKNKTRNINNTPLNPPKGKTSVKAEDKTAAKWKPERFEAFWRYYRAIPGENGRRRNENKAGARRAWDRLKPDDALLRTIAKALEKQLATAEWQRGIGIPMCATYLNQHRWEDAEDLPEPGEQSSEQEPPKGGHSLWT